MGLTPSQAVEFVPDPSFQRTSTQSTVVHLQQQYKGIPIFQAAVAVRFTPAGALSETVGNPASVFQDPDFTVQLSVQDAVLIAVRHIGTPSTTATTQEDHLGRPLISDSADINDLQLEVVGAFSNIPQQPMVLKAEGFSEAMLTSLVWFGIDNVLKLAWETFITLPNFTGQYRTIVDAQTGDILYCHESIHAADARANVYPTDPNAPRQMTVFPKPLSTYNLDIPNSLPDSFPDPWIRGHKVEDSLESNHVSVTFIPPHISLTGHIQQNTLTFNPSDELGDEQKLLNAFYFTCFLHDYFYLLGFREADGNFQTENFNRGGLDRDLVKVQLFNQPISGTARMLVPIDGQAAVMRLGIEPSTNRHTALDGSVIFHEFSHGVTNRLIGGSMNDSALEAPQSRGLAEGLSDYFACTLTRQNVLGSWLVNSPGGIRTAPYDDLFPAHFGTLGSGIFTQPHRIGEIWCAALMSMNRKIDESFGVQLVMDGLKLSPANPSFLDMRDAIFSALSNRLSANQITSNDYSSLNQKIWEAFSQFGMGPKAQCVGATLQGISADFQSIPPITDPSTKATVNEVSHIKLSAEDNLAIPDNKQIGISQTLTVQKAGFISSLTLSIKIQHSYPGDLSLTLVPPKGSDILLYSRVWSSTPSLNLLLTTEDPLLTGLIGKSAAGDWTLKVADHSALDTGFLQSWAIEFYLSGLSSTLSK